MREQLLVTHFFLSVTADCVGEQQLSWQIFIFAMLHFFPGLPAKGRLIRFVLWLGQSENR